MTEPQDITMLLSAASAGDAKAEAELLPLVYEELRRRAARMMKSERAEHTLQPTALVHDAYLSLVRQGETWQGRGHFFAVSAKAMRRILVDHARARARHKRGAGQPVERIDLGTILSPQRDDHVLALDEALDDLAKLDPRQAEIVALRFFAGCTVQEVAEALSMSKRAVEAEWTMAKAWLRRALTAVE